MIEYSSTDGESDFFHSDAESLARAQTVTEGELAAYRQEQRAIARGERPEVTKIYESIYRRASSELDLQSGSGV